MDILEAIDGADLERFIEAPTTTTATSATITTASRSELLELDRASLDSILAALSQTTISILYRPYIRPEASDHHYVRASRVIVLLWGIALTAFAIYCDTMARQFGDLIQFALAMAAYTYGALLGTFMFLNVWLIIWPNQKIVIASNEQVKSGGEALPEAAYVQRTEIAGPGFINFFLSDSSSQAVPAAVN